jgi:outer membrane protein assembly factor BamB
MKPVVIAGLIILVVLMTFPSVHAIEPVWTYSTQGNRIGGVAVSTGGSFIAVGAEKVLLFSKNGELLANEPYGDQVRMTPDGLHLLSSFGPTIYFFERNSTKVPFKKKWEYSLPDMVRSIDITDGGSLIVVSGQGEGTYIFSSSGTMTGSNKRYSPIVRVSSGGQRIVGVSDTSLYQYYKTGTSTRYSDISVGSQPAVMEISGTGSTVVLNNAQRLVSINAATGTQRWSVLATGDVISFAMTPDGSKLLVGTDKGTVDLVTSTGNRSWSYNSNPENKPGSMVKGVALSNDGKVAVAGTVDGKIIGLDSSGKELWSNQTKDQITFVAISGDGSFVIATGSEKVYAFSPSQQSLPPVQTPSPESTSLPQKSVTTIAKSVTQNTDNAGSATRDITPVPTTYSVIRTSKQSPGSVLISLLGLLSAFVVLVRRH